VRLRKRLEGVGEVNTENKEYDYERKGGERIRQGGEREMRV